LAKIKKTDNYDSTSIQTLEFPLNVQKRPSMYIGSLGSDGITHLIREIYDNALDEFLNGFTKKIKVIVNTDNETISITDYGRGIPIDNNILESILCSLHTGGKFDNDAYKTSAGLNGVGSSCVNALSDFMKVIVYKDGYIWKQSFSLGKPTSKIKKGDPTKIHGTKIIFKPNREYLRLGNEPFEDLLDFNNLKEYLNKQAYIHKGLNIILKNATKNEEYNFLYENGILDYIKAINTKPLIKKDFYISEIDKETETEVEIVLSWADNYNEITESFCNGIETTEHGTHITGLRIALTSVLTNYIKEKNLIPKKDDIKLDGKDFREGLITIVSIKCKDPIFQGQTKQKLSNPEIQGIVHRSINKYLTQFLDENPKEAVIIGNKAVLVAKSKKAANNAKTKVLGTGDKSFLNMNSISKLADCISKDREKRELFICEGDSAAGSLKEGREKEFQAIYGLRGKPLNTQNVNVMNIVNTKSNNYNKEIADLVTILGCNVGDNCDPDKCKYKRVIILSDADIDGSLEV